MMKRILMILFVFFIIYLVPLFLVVSNSQKIITSKVDYLIVLGAKVNDDKPTKVLEERLNQAYNYYKENPNVKIIVSGGQGLDEQYSEAYVMKNYLINKGVNPQVIIMEDKSTNTQENLENTKKIIGKQKSIGLVTNDFHIYRSSLLCNEIFQTTCALQSAKTHLYDSLLYYLREPFAIYKSLLFLMF